jgi:multiple sugar transport system permease protein
MSIFSRIVLPLAKLALATVALFTLLYTWNDFLGPLIYLNDGSKYTPGVGLAAFRGQNRTHWDLMMAAATVVTMPIVVLFFLRRNNSSTRLQ